MRRIPLLALAALAFAATAGRAAPPPAVGHVVGATVAVSGVPVAAPAATAPVVHAAAAGGANGGVRAVAAAASGVTIRDFSFGPRAITVHVGETVTWTNAGPTAHTATADDGGFDTGTLKAGQRGSRTFTSAGTFAYHCTLHPFMRGTVEVVAAASGGGSAAPSGPPPAPATSAAPASTPTPAHAAPTLPRTGLDAPWLAAVGAASLALGLVLRARTRPR